MGWLVVGWFLAGQSVGWLVEGLVAELADSLKVVAGWLVGWFVG